MQITKALLKQTVPAKLKSNISDTLVDKINDLVEDDMVRENFKENFITYSNVLKEGTYSIQQYLDAVHWCTHRLLGSGVGEAYAKTFPERYERLVQRGATTKQISSFATAYRKNKLVNAIMDQSMIPAHIYNMDVHQDAINKLASVMSDSNVSDRVQVDAAIGLLTHLKAPEVTKMQVDVAVKDDSIKELKDITRALAAQQHEMISGGFTNTQTVARQSIVKTIPQEEDYVDGQ